MVPSSLSIVLQKRKDVQGRPAVVAEWANASIQSRIVPNVPCSNPARDINVHKISMNNNVHEMSLLIV